MREIKFRFYSNPLGRLVVPDDSIFVGALKDPNMNPMQYTGLKDKNGKEICEGDVLRYHSKNHPGDFGFHQRQVTWDNDFACFKIVKIGKYENDQLANQSSGLNPSKLEKLEVIGNIHENPELLQSKQEPKEK